MSSYASLIPKDFICYSVCDHYKLFMSHCKIWYFMGFFFLNSVLRPFQDYFSSYETGQSVGGQKRENPEKKTPGTPVRRVWLVSHVASAVLEPEPDTAIR